MTNFIFFIKNLKNKEKEASTNFVLSCRSSWEIQKNLFAQTNQGSTFPQTSENSKMFNITSKYFSFFNNKTPAI